MANTLKKKEGWTKALTNRQNPNPHSVQKSCLSAFQNSLLDAERLNLEFLLKVYGVSLP